MCVDMITGVRTLRSTAYRVNLGLFASLSTSVTVNLCRNARDFSPICRAGERTKV